MDDLSGGHAATTQKHLELLNSRMSRVGAEAHQIATRFHYGGIVVVIALLNADFFLLGREWRDRVGLLTAAGAAALVLLLSGYYFKIITERIQYSRWVYRLERYRYDVTLHALLLGVSPATISNALLRGLDPMRHSEPKPLARDASFVEVLDYLEKLHGRELAKLDWKRDWRVAMAVVALTLVLRVFIY